MDQNSTNDAMPADEQPAAEASQAEQAPAASNEMNESAPAAGDAPQETVATTEEPQSVKNVLMDLGSNTVYLMGTSFILGVLFTVFVLLVLDFVRRNAEDQK